MTCCPGRDEYYVVFNPPSYPLVHVSSTTAAARILRSPSVDYSLTQAKFEQLQWDMSALSKAYAAANQSTLNAQGHLLVMKRSQDSILSLSRIKIF